MHYGVSKGKGKPLAPIYRRSQYRHLIFDHGRPARTVCSLLCVLEGETDAQHLKKCQRLGILLGHGRCRAHKHHAWAHPKRRQQHAAAPLVSLGTVRLEWKALRNLPSHGKVRSALHGQQDHVRVSARNSFCPHLPRRRTKVPGLHVSSLI